MAQPQYRSFITPEERDVLATIWFEKARPGHTVEIVEFESDRHYPYRRKVTIKHLTAHNKRVSTWNTLLEWRNFKARYAPVPDQKQALLEAAVERAKHDVLQNEAVHKRLVAKLNDAQDKLSEHRAKTDG